MSDHLGRVDLSACGDFILKSEPQQVTVPEDLRELYDLAKCGAFATLNKKIVSAIERLGAAEHELSQYRKALNFNIEQSRAERDRLKEELSQANAGFEEYERKFYLTQDRAEAAEAKVAELEGKLAASIAAYEAQRQFSQDNLAEALRRVSKLEGKP